MKSNMQMRKIFISRCQVHAGEVCRPTKLPLAVPSSDTDDSVYSATKCNCFVRARGLIERC